MDIIIELTLGALAYALVLLFASRKLGNPKRLAELNKLISQKRKEHMELIKSNAHPDLIKAKQDEMMGHATESMRHAYKPLIVTFPLFLILAYGVLPTIFPSHPTLTVLSFTLSYSSYFFYAGVIMSLIFSTAISTYENRKDKQKQMQATTVSSEMPHEQ